MAGKTDIQIMKEGLKLHKRPHMDGNVEKMINGYIRFLEKEVDNPLRHLKPGIKESLDSLNEMKITLGLLKNSQDLLSPKPLKTFLNL